MNTLTPSIETIDVTPALAKEWLTRNMRNRPASTVTIEKYRRDMADGNWQFTGDAIRFDAAHNLIDGQHRLSAIAAMPPRFAVPLLVIKGLEQRSQLVMDQGRRRTPGQQLSLLGIKHANIVAAVARLTIMWEEGLMFRDNKLQQLTTAAQVEQWAADNSASVALIGEHAGDIRAVDTRPSVTGTAFVRIAKINEDQAVAFLSSLATGANLSEGDPILTLKNRFHKIRRDNLGVSERDLLAFFILAWNAHRAGKAMSKFQRPRGGKWSVNNFPVPR